MLVAIMHLLTSRNNIFLTVSFHKFTYIEKMTDLNYQTLLFHFESLALEWINHAIIIIK